MKKHVNWFYLMIGFVILYIVSIDDYLVFHTVTELYTIVVASVIFVITLNARKYFNNQYMVLIGISYFFVAIIDLFHLLSYPGMPIYTHLNYPATQLWIAARYFQSIVLLLAFSFMYGREINIKRVYIINIVVTIALLVSILWLEIFPVAFIEGSGLTPFKKISEYIISLILIITLYLIYKRKTDFSKKQYIYLNLALISTIISELLFTFYIDAFSISNLFGHYFKLLSFIFMYQLIVKEGLRDPYNLIFKELEESRKELELFSSKDPLTGLHNRRSLLKGFTKVVHQSMIYKKIITVAMIDIDDFKKYNDKFGHFEGDQILIEISQILLKTFNKPLDIVSRYGGEEFVIVLFDYDEEMVKLKMEEVHHLILELKRYIDNDKKMSLTVSIGYILTKAIEELDLENAVRLADDEMYKAKAKHKNCSVGRVLK